jgi:hypothetical protein
MIICYSVPEHPDPTYIQIDDLLRSYHTATGVALCFKKKEINLDNLLFSTDPIYIKIEKKFSNCKSNRIFAIVQKHVTTSFMKRILEIVIIYFCHVFSAIIVGHCAYNKIIHSQFLHVIVIRHCCKK